MFSTGKDNTVGLARAMASEMKFLRFSAPSDYNYTKHWQP